MSHTNIKENPKPRNIENFLLCVPRDALVLTSKSFRAALLSFKDVLIAFKFVSKAALISSSLAELVESRASSFVTRLAS